MSMRTKTTTLCTIAIAGLGAVLAGCGGDAEPAQTAASAETADAPLKLVYIGAVQDNPAYTAVACGMRDFGEQNGASISVQNPDEFAASAQIPVLNAVVQGDPDGIVVSPSNQQALQAPLAQVESDGIPVATALNAVSDPSALTAAATSDEVAGGKLAADELAKALDGQTGKVGVVTFTPGGSSATDGRLKGFEEQIRQYDDLDYVGFEVTDSLAANDGAAAANALLTANPDLLGIVTTFPDAAIGVGTALRQQGKDGDVFHLAYDVVPGSLKALQGGTIQELINFDYSELGRIAAQQVVNAANGDPVEASTLIAPLVVTPENIDDPEVAATFQLLECAD